MSKGYPLAECLFEFPPELCGTLAGKISAEFYEIGKPDPVNIIRCSQAAYVKVRIDFSASGLLARLLCGTWCVAVAFESCGPGPEFKEYVMKDFQICDNPVTEVDIQIPPNTFPCEVECGDTYEICVTVTARDKCNPPKPVPFAGYCKGGPLMVYP